jgi:HEAT repeat protein
MVLSMTLALGQARPPDVTRRCWELLKDAAQDKNPDVRKDAAEALSLIPVNGKVLQQLDSMLDDHDVQVRIAAVATLGDFKDTRTVPLLRKALADPIPEVDFAAAKVLYHLHDPEGERFLLAVVAGESKGSSSYLSREKRSALRMLHTPTKLFMFAATEAAGFAPVPGLGVGISSAQGILSNPDSSAKASALLLVARSKDPAMDDAVESALSAKEWPVRAAAAHVVATHPFPALRQKLVPLLDNKKGAVRLRAAAYIRLQQPSPGKPRR